MSYFFTTWAALRSNIGIFGGNCKQNYRGWPKKVATHKKWVTWFIMAINEENVNKSYVFVLA